MATNELIYHSFLPHESALAALPIGIPMEESGFGANTGGTAPAASNIVLAFQDNASDMMMEITGRNWKVKACLDTPLPRPNIEIPTMPFETVTYRLPYVPGVDFKDVWEMKDIYMKDPDWVQSHMRMMNSKRLMLHGLEHTLGMELGEILMSYVPDTRDLHKTITRAHSPFRVYVQQSNPDYYKERYAGRPGEEYFLHVQEESLKASDIILFPTEIERVGTIDAVVKAGIASRVDLERRTTTIGIPVNLTESLNFSRFNPHADENLQREYRLKSRDALRVEQMNLINGQIRQNLTSGVDPGFFGGYLSPEKNYLSYCGRLDKEKGIFDAVMAYADFVQANQGNRQEFATFLVIGGLAQKEGNQKLFDDMIKRIHALPPHLQQLFIIPAIPMPHDWLSAVSDMEIYASEEESFNMAEKEASAFGALVALSEVSGHIGTNVKGEFSTDEDTAIWFRPVPGNWQSYLPAFDAAQHPREHDHIAQNSYRYVQRFSSRQVCWDILDFVNKTYPGYFQQQEI